MTKTEGLGTFTEEILNGKLVQWYIGWLLNTNKWIDNFPLHTRLTSYIHRVIMKVKTHFLLKMFRHKSLTVKIICSDRHLFYFIFFLIFDKYVHEKCRYINTLGNNWITKKHFKLNKLIMNCYRYPHIG